MNPRRRALCGVALALVSCAAIAKPPEPDSVEALRGHVEFLAASEFEERFSGSDGARRAAGYIKEQLQAIGATALPGADDLLQSFEFTAGVGREKRSAQNVVGYLPPTAGAESDVPYLVLGAHYDHLGYGADDNASGVAAVLATGALVARRPRSRGIVLGFWSGETSGPIGSSAFVSGEPVARERIAAYLDFDMVGRMEDNRLNLGAVESSSVWPRLIERANVAAGFDVRTSADPYLRTDSLVFYRAGVPTLAFSTGRHDDDPRSGDRVEQINFEDLGRITRFAATLAGRLDRLDGSPDYVEVQAAPDREGDPGSRRPYTGTIPDYATDVEGLRLGGVAAGGPADRAGLRAGDVIVEFGGRKIANAYDYMDALDAVRIDQPVQVVCLRDGDRLEFTVTPTARP